MYVFTNELRFEFTNLTIILYVKFDKVKMILALYKYEAK